MTDPQEAKYKEMQKYVPFIQRVIEKLKVNNDHQADNPRKAQLQKMEMLHDLLTNKHKKIKIETLIKCEGVLIKLQAKIEKQTTILQNEDSILSDVRLKPQTSANNNKHEEDILGPASPPPEVIPDDDIGQPVEIPTERRCSPILINEIKNFSADKKLQSNTHSLSTHQKSLQDSVDKKSDSFENVRKKLLYKDLNTGKSSFPDKNFSAHQKPQNSSHKTASHERIQQHHHHHHHHHGKETQHHKSLGQDVRNIPLPKEKISETQKTPAPEEKLQTVKVVITEPLPAHFKQQHFPPSSKFLQRSSVCHSNLRSLPQANQTGVESNEAYSPEESWDQYNESHNKSSNIKIQPAPTVFTRLGAKVTEEPPNNKSSGRYTPIPDVLKSPPLSVSDINNLLLESGSDKTLNDISEIGTRRPPKTEDPQILSPNNSFEFIRKKLAQTVKLNSPKREPDASSVSSLPNERIALKYNPHPRQERLPSVSSTDGSECSTQSKVSDPRIKPKLPISSSHHSLSQLAAANVNVLPAINLSDPRLKRQTTPDIKQLPLTPPTFSSTPNNDFAKQLYGRRQDPRISRITTANVSASTIPKLQPGRRMSTNQPPPHYSSEENWDSDEDKKTQPSAIKKDPRIFQNKSDTRNESSSKIEPSFYDSKIVTPSARDNFNQSFIQKTNSETEASTSSLKKKPKNKLVPATMFFVPNAPKSDTEEDWDAEPETQPAKPKPLIAELTPSSVNSSVKAKPLIAEVPPSPINSSPILAGVSPHYPQVTTKTIIGPRPLLPTPIMPLHHLGHAAHVPYRPHIPHAQPQYQPSRPPMHHNYRMQNPQINYRFNSTLNDSSERTKYFEAKKQKAIEPRTYKEFREAKERERAKEAAIKKAAEEAEARKKANEIKETQKDAAKNENAQEQVKTGDDGKKEKKPTQKDNKKSLVGESTLDKMYRTQNFNTSFPKANTSFKIPKKKTDDQIKEDTKKTDETPAVAVEQQKQLPNDKTEKKFKSNQTDVTAGKLKSDNQELNKKQDKEKAAKNQTKTIENKSSNKQSEITSDDKKEKEPEQILADSSAQEATLEATKPNNEELNDKLPVKTEKTKSHKHLEKDKQELENKSKEKSQEHLLSEDEKTNIRDPRCRPKAAPSSSEEIAEENKEAVGQRDQEHKTENLENFTITSSESQVLLKPQQKLDIESKQESSPKPTSSESEVLLKPHQQNLEKFNKLTQDKILNSNRILRRRNTMVVFDSAPLVDKEKLKRANALLFEDVQEEEKRKRKQAEEEKLIARRNKHLEEMFKKTDDNCTVSTQNIIVGKRRTRPSVNFNETVHARNVFKHTTLKDNSSGNAAVASSSTKAGKVRSNFKIKVKNLTAGEKEKNDESDDDTPLVQIVKKDIKIKKEPLKAKGSKTLSDDHQSEEEDKTDETGKETKTNIKKEKATRSSINRKTIKSVEKKEVKLRRSQSEEHQNCAVSSTSTDINNVDETTCSSTSTNTTSKKETDDNEPTSTASKSRNPTPEPNEPILKEIVDQILTPNSNRGPILDILAQILSEEKLALIKSLIESSNKQNNEDEQTKEDEDEEDSEAEQGQKKVKRKTSKRNIKNSNRKIIKTEDDEEVEKEEEDEEEAQGERKPILASRACGGKNIPMPKKKRTELDRLNEDIRDMFICNGVLTATGRRMCTIMGKDVASTSISKDTNKTSITSPTTKPKQQGIANKKKNEILKPPATTRTLRRSTRSCKTTEDNEDNESIVSRTTEDSLDDSNTEGAATDTTPLRKMPVLKPHTPIKLPDEETAKLSRSNETTGNKRKSDSNAAADPNAKKSKNTKELAEENLEPDEKDSGTEGEAEDEETKTHNAQNNIPNTNLHWHNQSKYLSWCMMCVKKIHSRFSPFHYKSNHCENYISRMAPVILQKYKQGKLNQPLFGVKKINKKQCWFYRCPFCLKYNKFNLEQWLEHFQHHTAEYRYECSKCHRPDNKKNVLARHIKSCEGATILTSTIKLNGSNVINAHVCHLCNYIQLQRNNLERHYTEQHQVEQKTVELLGYSIKLFDVENVECVSEEKATEIENEARESIKQNEQVIDIDDDIISAVCSNSDSALNREKETGERQNEAGVEKDGQKEDNNLQEESHKNNETVEVDTTVITVTEDEDEEERQEDVDPLDISKISFRQRKQPKKPVKQRGTKTTVFLDLTESQSNDFEVIDQEITVQDIQDELLLLAAKAAEGEENEGGVVAEANKDTQLTVTETTIEIPKDIQETTNTPSKDPAFEPRDNNAAEPLKISQVASNAFMPTRDDSNSSPTIQILAQSIITIDEPESQTVKEKPITMAERLSQRFKDLQNDNTSTENFVNISKTTSNENAFEKLIDDTLFELTKEKDSANKNSSNKTPIAAAANAPVGENVFERLFSDTAMELEREDVTNSPTLPQLQTLNVTKELPPKDAVTVISDDEDWEDIEITETAPTAASSAHGNMQKSKSKGLFQKFGIFKGNNAKSKKHLTPMVFMPKKKTKEKLSPAATTASSNSPITTSATATKAHENANTNSSNSNTGFKPVVNIMDGLFPDSPCNDPIDLVPELAPLEPLQDLNDISSILDSNLSAVSINASENHASIEDALDFVSEQQANDKQTNPMPSQTKTAINNISHVGFSLQTTGESSFKFYCLLQNCSFLYSSDSIGLETHFMCEHAQIKWNGYCLMCQTQCLPNNEDNTSPEYPISKEIHHMMEKHANKTALELNADANQNSNSSSQDNNEERPKIKIRRLTGDCLSRTTPEIPTNTNEVTFNNSTPITMLGALLVAEPKPPTKEMPPQPQMPLTEPLLLASGPESSSQLPFTNASSDFLITSVTSAATVSKPATLQISSVVSLNNEAQLATTTATTTGPQQIQIPKIANVRTLVPKAGSLWTQQIENDRLELAEAAAESLEVSRILQNAARPTSNNEVTRSINDSPVLVAETLPIAQSKTGDFVVTQTLSAQYNEFSSAALGFNISIAATSSGDNSNQEILSSSSASVPSRQYKCMGNGCKFVSRVPVAMSDHLRFHERRNFSNKQDYLACGFCFYCASDVEDYMKHANQFHIINKGGAGPSNNSAKEAETVSSLSKKIHSILKHSNSSTGQSRSAAQAPATEKQVQESLEVYQTKLRATIDEIVGPTGLADDKLYRCVVKNCHTQLTENTFLSHIMFHISTTGGNPSNYLYKCPHCTAQYHRPAGIKAHIKNHARNRYFCYLCDETSTNPGQLLKHFSEKHWHTLNMFTTELLPPKISTDGSESQLDGSYYVAYTIDLTPEEVRKFGEKLILEWQRKVSGSKTHFKSSEIDLLPMTAIFQFQVNCGECEYKTKVRTNMFRHLMMHKQNPNLASKIGASSVVDPVNPVPCLNSNERFFDKMTNLASSSLIPSSSAGTTTTTITTKATFKLPQDYVEECKRFVCGCPDCNYHTIFEDLFRTHLSALHSSEMTFTCPFCKEEVCKRGISIDRILNHLRFHGVTLFRCEECNYFHHLRYVVERHIKDKHSTMKINLITHTRSNENSKNGITTSTPFAGKKYNPFEGNPSSAPTSTPALRSTNNETSVPKPSSSSSAYSKGKAKWECDVCGHKAATVGLMQNHCQQQHSVKNQYKCAHCNFGSQQLSQILHHIDEKHSGKAREARTMYHKIFSNEEVVDMRPLWQRNDPTRVRHIRGILMEDEEESEEYRKKLALTEEVDDDSNEDQSSDVEETEVLNANSFILGYEFGCYHCSFKTEKFEILKEQHYAQNHNCQEETAKPFWYRLHRRLCCPECRSFLGNYNELQQHLQSIHKKRFYAADIKMFENDDTTSRLLCGYCPFHCASADQLLRHHTKAQHWPQDIRIDNNDQVMEILALGKSEISYQCTLCADIFPNRVATVQHACSTHGSEDNFSFRELSNSLIYRCNSCCFTSTVEIELLRHTIDHYSRFKVCSFCKKAQTSFNDYMQHCYAEHKNQIEKFRTIYPFEEIKTFLLQILVIFPSGLVLNKRNLHNTQYGKIFVIYNLYEEIYKISQQPPIPRLVIGRSGPSKSIEVLRTSTDSPSVSFQDNVFNAMLPQPKKISKRRRTVAIDREDNHYNSSTLLKPKSVLAEKTESGASKRRPTIDQARPVAPVKTEEFSAPLKANKISKRRSTVAVDRESLFSLNFCSTSKSLLTELQARGKKRKGSLTQAPSPKHVKETYPLNLDMEPFSFYGKKPEVLDLSKIYTKVVIGGIKTPLTIDKFKLLFNIDCQLKLTKCDANSQLLRYSNYKHIKKACPASEKSRYDSDKRS